MALTYGFYNSVGGDRVYSAAQMSQILDGILTDGVFDTIGTKLAVRPGVGLQVLVGTGRAWFNSTWTYNDTDLALDIDPADMLLDRIDAVVLEVNTTSTIRANAIKVLKGTPATLPEQPALTNTPFVHQYPLAYISVKANVVAILATDITDTIGTAACPYIGLSNEASGEEVDAGLSYSKFITPRSLGSSSLVPFASPAALGDYLVADGLKWISRAQDGWIPDGSVWTSTNTPLTKSSNSDPAAGMNISLLLQSGTAGLTTKGMIVLVESDAGSDLTLHLSNPGSSIAVLYLATNHVSTNLRVTAIEPNVVVTVSGDKTGLIGVGDRVKLTQGGITKYFIVMAVGPYSDGSTPVTLYTGPDVAAGYNNYLTNAPITNVFVSHKANPAGFPKDPSRWAYEFFFNGVNFMQSSPTYGTWYNPGGVGILIPKGDFQFDYKISTGLCYSASVGCITSASISPSLAELHPQFTWCQANISTSTALYGIAFGSGILKQQTPTSYLMLGKAAIGTGISSLIHYRDTGYRNSFRFVPAYL